MEMVQLDAFVVGTAKPAQINAHLVKFYAFVVVIRTKMIIFRCTGSNSNSFCKSLLQINLFLETKIDSGIEMLFKAS
ncbi:hypothetical protein Hanom_Chr15g01344771 [Helianthus anomalus]